MRLLFDQNAPRTLRRLLPEHEVTTARDMGWSELENGELIAAAEAAGFQVLVTLDKRIRYQQNLTGRTIGIVVLPEQDMFTLEAGIGAVKAAIDRAGQGVYVEFELPRPMLIRTPFPKRDP